MVSKKFERTARYKGRNIEIPYTITFYDFGPKGPKTFAEVVVNWKEMRVKGRYCGSIRGLSNEQLNECDIETNFSFNPNGRLRKQQKSSARHLVYKRLERIINNPQIRGLIY